MEDTVRVLRVLEYVGPRSWVERTLGQSITGTFYCGSEARIRAATVGDPEVFRGDEAAPANRCAKHVDGHRFDILERHRGGDNVRLHCLCGKAGAWSDPREASAEPSWVVCGALDLGGERALP
jgi:hypothetical protein